MPVSREVGLDLIRTLTLLYTDLEGALYREMARELTRDMGASNWTEKKLAAAGSLRRRAEAALAYVNGQANERALLTLLAAFQRGSAAGLVELTRLGLRSDRSLQGTIARLLGLRGRRLQREVNALRTAIPGLDAIQALANTLAGNLRQTNLPILRWVDDAYRQVVAAGGVVDVLAGVATRRKAAGRTWSRLLNRGVTGFTDRRGRRWELASYVEMATRTATAQAAVEGHLGRLQEAGIDLVIVSDAPQECKLCRPWEGKVLARSGSAGTQTVRNVRTGQPMTVEVEGTLSQAFSAGLMHPNCRHSISAYLPGATEPITNTADPKGDADRQRLRTLERRIRTAKSQRDVALDPTEKARYRQRVSDLQDQIEELVDNSSVQRQRGRERAGTAR